MSTRATPTGPDRDRRLVVLWMVTSLVLFLVLVTLGITMRLAQGAVVELSSSTFYAVMTMHGLGMAGTLFSAGIAMVWWVAARHARPSRTAMWVAYALFLAGAIALLAATLVGKFAAGWYALYPLPFLRATWPGWATGTTIVALMAMGLAWLIAQLDILRALAVEHGNARMFAWDRFRAGAGEPAPAGVLIGAICAVAGVLGTIVGAATLMTYLFKWLAPATEFDPLLLKNGMFMFGHTIVNVAMYCGICVIYELMPRFTGRPWKVTRTVAVAWNSTLFFILFAYFHHLYMDFAQPVALQVLGQIASYGSAVPATAVTVFGLGSQIHRSGLRWSFVPATFALGILGWVLGGITAVVDSTIAVNLVFHNTLWVPAHFHTYFLVGYVLILLGFVHHVLDSRAERLAKTGLIAMIAGGYAFVLMFFLGGMDSVPRRFATYQVIPYPTLAERATELATWGGIAGSVFLLGALIYCVSLAVGRRRGAGAGQ
jgi:cytochrome c oxidase subunit 1